MEGRDTRERKKTVFNPENPAPARMEAVAPVKSRVPFCCSTMPCMTFQRRLSQLQVLSSRKQEPDTTDFSCRIDYQT